MYTDLIERFVAFFIFILHSVLFFNCQAMAELASFPDVWSSSLLARSSSGLGID